MSYGDPTLDDMVHEITKGRRNGLVAEFVVEHDREWRWYAPTPPASETWRVKYYQHNPSAFITTTGRTMHEAVRKLYDILMDGHAD